VLRLLYTLILTLATPFVLLRLFIKGRRLPAYRERIGERFGFVKPAAGGVEVWIHAVSVGEVLAARPLIQALLARHGDGRVWVTTTTPTGSARVIDAYGSRVHHSYAPYDLPGPVSRFLQRVRPARVVVMETELWPNLFHACKDLGVPLMVANARLSKRSFRGYARFRHFARGTLAQCSAIAAQSKADARRFLTLGAPQGRVGVMGNLKFDVMIPDDQVKRGRELRSELGAKRRIWVAVSTHPGEEQDILEAHAAVLDAFPDAALILVPRHPQRFDEVWDLIRDSGLRGEQRSRQLAMARVGRPLSLDDTQVFLGNTMGEMFYYLAAADVAFVGGSLVGRGGHNVLEPAALGLPVLFGPDMSNFVAARSLLMRRGAAVETTSAMLAGEVAELFADDARREMMGQAGIAAVAGNRGALGRLLGILDELPQLAGVSGPLGLPHERQPR